MLSECSVVIIHVNGTCILLGFTFRYLKSAAIAISVTQFVEIENVMQFEMCFYFCFSEMPNWKWHAFIQFYSSTQCGTICIWFQFFAGLSLYIWFHLFSLVHSLKICWNFLFSPFHSFTGMQWYWCPEWEFTFGETILGFALPLLPFFC